MQVPKRRSQMEAAHSSSRDDHLSEDAIRALREELARLKGPAQRRAAEDVIRAREMGDLSENAAYTEAKGRLLRINTRILEIEDILKHAVIITRGPADDGTARIGATVTVRVNGKERRYELTGSQETDPGMGRISHTSPVGAALVGHGPGETVTVERDGRVITYEIVSVE